MFKNAGKLEERDKVGGDFTPFKKGEYILTVQDTELGDTDEMVWVGRVAQPTGNKIPQLTLKFSVSKADGSDVIDENGAVVPNAKYRFWVNEGNLGWNKKTNAAKNGRLIIS